MRIVCDRCGDLEHWDPDHAGGAAPGQLHANCHEGGTWLPFPELPGTIATDLFCQVVHDATPAAAFEYLRQSIEFIDLTVFPGDELPAGLAPIIDRRLTTGRWREPKPVSYTHLTLPTSDLV